MKNIIKILIAIAIMTFAVPAAGQVTDAEVAKLKIRNGYNNLEVIQVIDENKALVRVFRTMFMFKGNTSNFVDGEHVYIKSKLSDETCEYKTVIGSMKRVRVIKSLEGDSLETYMKKKDGSRSHLIGKIVFYNSGHLLIETEGKHVAIPTKYLDRDYVTPFRNSSSEMETDERDKYRKIIRELRSSKTNRTIYKHILKI